MLRETLNIKNAGSLEYARAVFYGHEYSDSLPIEKRPVVVIVPGGGYEHTSVREGEIVAMQFLSFGYHAAVLNYSCAPARYPVALLELAALIRLLREKAAEWHIDTDRIITLGFSAGGHLVGCLSSFWREKQLCEEINCDSRMIRPDGQILCYPVITSGPAGHQGSFMNLLGDDYSTKKGDLSLEKHINDGVPRSFVWHTFEDRSVPVQNSLLYVSALADAGIPVEYHLYEHGAHGASTGRWISAKEPKQLVPEIDSWVGLAHSWIERSIEMSRRII
ncbi:MAG: alpha/beta hydrolase [Lachnospiraceae bacterium]|nr:alpha/beta hydrolase [Lachnospiraceae bacterium]